MVKNIRLQLTVSEVKKALVEHVQLERAMGKEVHPAAFASQASVEEEFCESFGSCGSAIDW